MFSACRLLLRSETETMGSLFPHYQRSPFSTPAHHLTGNNNCNLNGYLYILGKHKPVYIFSYVKAEEKIAEKTLGV